MRIVLKLLFRSVTVFMTIAVAAFVMVPATDSEAAALGRDNNQFMLVQMRLARLMMATAPEFAVAKYAEATGLPDYLIRDMLEAKASGQPLFQPDYDYAAQDFGPVDASPAPTQRRTEAGGALFVRP